MKLNKSNKRVAIVEQHPAMGGNCTHRSTIPSKTLRHNVQTLSVMRSHAFTKRLMGSVNLNFGDILNVSRHVIQKQADMREHFYYRNHVDIYYGTARFIDAHTIEVEGERGNIERFCADYFVIATGALPLHPDGVDFHHPRVYDSDSILQANISINSVAIYGAGVIGCEYASIFGSLGVKVNLINTSERLLSFLDAEITDALGYHLRDQGVVIRHNEEYERVEPFDDYVLLHCKSGKRLKSDVLLWTRGRPGNTHHLNLEALDIQSNKRGNLEVNEDYQTSQPHIYAVGDVIGLPGLASASYDQGRFAATHIIKGEGHEYLTKNIPTGIYTNPEISSIGATEANLTQRKIPYEVGRAFFRSIARAQITGHTVGMMKILFHTETLEILGIHCFGQQSSEIIHIGQAIMSQPPPANNLKYFINTTFNYPTMAEAYRIAALNGLNRLV